MSASATSPLDDDEVLCVSCGYSLRGLSAEGECPECGALVAQSLGGNRLSNADPAWLKRIANGQTVLSIGVTTLAWSTTLGFFALILLPIVLISVTAGSSRAVPLVFAIAGGTVGILTLISLIACTVGAFLVTALDPRDSLREAPTSMRLVARWSLVATIAIVVFVPGLEAIGPLANQKWLQSLVFCGIVAALAVAIASLMTWLAALAERIPDYVLRRDVLKRRKELCTVLIILALLTAASSVISVVYGPGRIQPGASGFRLQTIHNCMTAIVVLALLVMLGRAASTMRAFRKRLRHSLADANIKRYQVEP